MAVDKFTRKIMLSSGKFAEEKHYWLQKLAGVSLTRLAADQPGGRKQGDQHDSLHVPFPDHLAQQLSGRANGNPAAMYVFALTSAYVLLANYTGQRDLAAAMPPFRTGQRQDVSADECFVLRAEAGRDDTFRDYLMKVRAAVMEARTYQNLAFRDMAELVGLEHPEDAEHYPILAGCASLHDLPPEAGTADLYLVYTFEDGRAELDIHYHQHLFWRSTIERFSQHYLNILQAALAGPETRLEELEMMSEAERTQIRQVFNNTLADYPRDKTMTDLFEEQVTRTPDADAVLFEGERLSYAELNEQANRLARFLQQKGVGPDRMVGVMLERSAEMMIALLAIHKAGGAYLPLNPAFPSDRIGYMLEDSGTDLLLTTSDLLARIEEIGFAGETVDVATSELYTGDGSNLARVHTPSDAAYIIYTSGTTGKPKGTVIEHGSLVNRLHWMQRRYPIGAGDTILQKTPYTFDVSVWELFWWSAVGARVCFLSVDGEKDPAVIVDAIAAAKVTTMHFVPSMLNVTLEYLEARPHAVAKLASLRHVFASGEALNPAQAERFYALFADHQARLINLYGPTEATIDVSYFDCLPGETGAVIPIGKPIDNTELYILDEQRRLQPIGVAGELHIAGVGLARGYLNKPELTEEKFVPHPFRPGERMYKTGDLARWMPDGNIEYLGRIDHQVKVRGYRIELGEIENLLLQHPAIKETVVLALEDGQGDKSLCAYLVAGQDLDAAEAREHLSCQLPDYMIPSHFVLLERMPLSANGKADRKALPKPTGPSAGQSVYAPPRNEAEAAMASLWQAVLGLERVGIDDNFFALGGHSLKATTLVSKVHGAFQVELTLREVFKYPTVRELTAHLEHAQGTVREQIAPAAVQEAYPVSFAQKGLFVQESYQELGTTYNMPRVILAEGPLDARKFEAVFQQLIMRHESLRTSFHVQGGEIVQQVQEQAEFSIRVTPVEEAELPAKVQALISPFDLGQAPLLRVHVLRLSDERHVILFDMHHIISDGVSMDVLAREFETLYGGGALPALPLQYKDFAVWQTRRADSEAMQQQEAYWKSQLQGELPVLNLPLDHPRPAVLQFEGSMLPFRTDHVVSSRLQKFSAETGSTLYMILLAAFNLLLAKYSGQDDIIVGTPTAGRPTTDVDDVIGMFINMLPMRNQPAPGKTFREFVGEVKERALAAFEHQDLQFEELVDRLNLPRDWSRNPVFDTMFIMQNVNSTVQMQLGELSLRGGEFEQTTAKYDLKLEAFEERDGLLFHLEYSTRLFKPETAERMAAHFRTLLQAALADPDVPMAELEMMSEAERTQILQAFNNTAADYPRDKTMTDLFEEQVTRTPDADAVLFEGKKLSYAELNEQANRLARFLQQKGVGPDRMVGVMLERSVEMMIALLAIHKAGGAYLPVHPAFPPDRIGYMLEDSGTDLLLTTGDLQERIAGLEFAGETVDVSSSELYTGDGSNLARVHTPSDAAYIIYTSGTTGKPKGTVIEHGALVNRLHWMQRRYPIGAGDTILQKTPYTFDVSVWELFWWSAVGARVCFLSVDGEKDPAAIVEAIASAKVTTMHFVPSMLSVTLEYLEARPHAVAKLASLRHVFASGEALNPSQAERFYALFADHQARLINLYGPTEATIDVSYFDCLPGETGTVIPIGKPIDNTELYILDEQRRLQPIGVAGELHIAGVGLARGYLNKPGLTEEKFVPHPFRPGERMYKTGDLARWMPDGNIEYLGRIDHQVKVRGFRIELGEIEHLLLQHPAVKEAVAVATQAESGESELCAYFTADTALDVTEVREHLQRQLPAYMVPSQLIVLEQMPLSPNGKIDRKALPKPQRQSLPETPYAAPRTSVEAQLALIWQKLLGQERIGIDDNFFALGGHSLKATSLVSQVHKEFQADLPLRDVFDRPTIRQLAEHLSRLEQKAYAKIAPAPKREAYPVSAAQKRLFLLDRLTANSTAYNISGAALIEGKIDPERLNQAFQKLIARHETLRTSFHLLDGEPVQKVHDDVVFRVELLPGADGTDAELRERAAAFIRPFDLQQAPLLRVGLLQQSAARGVLVFDLHHIIADGVSMNLLLAEIAALYAGSELPELAVQYKDFSVWQHEQTADGAIRTQESYWLDALSGELPALQLPTDHPRPTMQSFAGHSVRFAAGAETTRRLKELTRTSGATLFMVLLAAYKALLARYSGQQDLIVGTPVAGRGHADIEGVIGMFVNTLAIRSRPQPDMTFRAFLEEVKEGSLGAFAHQDYPFEDLVDRLSVRRDFSRNPIFDTMFRLQQEAAAPNLSLEGVSLTPLQVELEFAKFDLELEASETANGIEFALRYCTGLFTRETAERIGNDLLLLLDAAAGDPERKLRDYELSGFRAAKSEPVPPAQQPPAPEPARFVPPANAREERLAALWQELLGLQQVGVHDNFFDIGGNSLKVISLVSKIYETYGLDLPIQDVIEAPTVRGLVERMTRKALTLRGERPILQLNRLQSRHLFAFPGIGGFGLVFGQLAEQMQNRTLYAFDYVDAPDLPGLYADLIQAAQPQGPYALLGYSSGGNLAYETAKALEARGQHVETLLLLDTVTNYRDIDLQENAPELRSNIEQEILAFLAEHPEIGQGEREVRYLVDLAENKYRSYARYLKSLTHQGQTDAAIHLILSEHPEQPLDKKDWAAFTASAVRTYQGSGEHQAMISVAAHLGRNARILIDILGE